MNSVKYISSVNEAFVGRSKQTIIFKQSSIECMYRKYLILNNVKNINKVITVS